MSNYFNRKLSKKSYIYQDKWKLTKINKIKNTNLIMKRVVLIKSK